MVVGRQFRISLFSDRQENKPGATSVNWKHKITLCTEVLEEAVVEPNASKTGELVRPTRDPKSLKGSNIIIGESYYLLLCFLFVLGIPCRIFFFNNYTLCKNEIP